MRRRDVVGLAAVAAAGLLVARRWQLRWGATPGVRRDPCPAMTLSPTLTSPRPALSPSARRLVRYGRGSPSWGRAAAGSTAMILSRTWSAVTFTARTRSCPSGRYRGRRPDQARAAGRSRVARWSGGGRLSCAAACRWGTARRPMTSPGLSCSGRTCPGQRGCSCGRDTHTAAVGTAPRRARRSGQFRHEPEDAPRDQGPGRALGCCCQPRARHEPI